MWELDPGAGIITAGSASVASEAWHTHLAISSFRRNGCSSTCNVAQRGGALHGRPVGRDELLEVRHAEVGDADRGGEALFLRRLPRAIPKVV
eukprot:3482937-Prymnesium_polylepis.2